MLEPDRILRMRTVLQRTGLSRATIYRKIKDGTFPAQLRISVHGCGWRESALNHWMADPEHYRAYDDKQIKQSSQKPHEERRTAHTELQDGGRSTSLRQDGVS